MTEPQPDITSRNKGLSSFLAGGDSKVNPVLWFFLLSLNALYTVIGVRLRDLRPNGACELNVNRTVGIVEHFDRVGLFWGLFSIYPIMSIGIVLVHIVHVLHRSNNKETAERQQQGEQEAKVRSVVEILHILSVNLLVIISGSLYIAADNFFFLIDPDHQTHNPSTTRGFIAGSSFICSVLVIVVTNWFEHSVYKCIKIFSDCKETNNKHEKNENGVRKICVTYHKPKNNLSGLTVVKILYYWSPLAGLIPMFDSLFISVVDEISGEDNVRSGFDCSNERGIEGAIIFYIAICIVFFISVVVVVVSSIINKSKHLPDYNNKLVRYCVYFYYIVYYLVMGIFFLITGLMFIAADNNWPWICLAKNDGNICYWVIVRVGLLAVVTVFSILLLLSSIVLSFWQCCEELKGNLNPAETAMSVRVITASEQTNTAAPDMEMQIRNTAKEENTMDGKITVNLVNESGIFTHAECDCEGNAETNFSIEFCYA